MIEYLRQLLAELHRGVVIALRRPHRLIVDPTTAHLLPGPGSVTSLRQVPAWMISTHEAELIAHSEHEQRRHEDFLAPFLAELDEAMAAFRIATEPLVRQAKLWHLQGHCPHCVTHDRQGHPRVRGWREDCPTGEIPALARLAIVR